MKLISKMRFLILFMIFFFFAGLSNKHLAIAATNSSTSVDSSATVQFDSVINVPDDAQMGGGNVPGSSGGYSGGSGSRPGATSYGKNPTTGSGLSGRLPQMGEYALNVSIFILGIILIILSIRYLYYRKLLHMD